MNRGAGKRRWPGNAGTGRPARRRPGRPPVRRLAGGQVAEPSVTGQVVTPEDVVHAAAVGRVGPLPERPQRGAPGGHRDVAPAQLTQQLGVEASQKGVDEGRVGLQRDYTVVIQGTGTGQQPVRRRHRRRRPRPARSMPTHASGGASGCAGSRPHPPRWCSAPGRSRAVSGDGSKAAITPGRERVERERAAGRLPGLPAGGSASTAGADGVGAAGPGALAIAVIGPAGRSRRSLGGRGRTGSASQ